MHRSANSVEKMQVFWPWSSLRMSAWMVPRTLDSTHARTSAASAASGSRPCSVRKASSRWSTAVLRNIASIAGAGPLIVIDTEVVGAQRSKPPYSTFEVVERRDRDAGGADLAVHVGARVGVAAVQRHRVERRRQAGGLVAGAEQLEAPVGAERVALAGEHPRRRLALALEREHARGEGEAARQALLAQEADELAVVLACAAGRPAAPSCPTAWCGAAGWRTPCRARRTSARRRCTAPRPAGQRSRSASVRASSCCSTSASAASTCSTAAPSSSAAGRPQVLAGAGELGLAAGALVVVADGLRDLPEVAHLRRRDHAGQAGRRLDGRPAAARRCRRAGPARRAAGAARRTAR